MNPSKKIIKSSATYEGDLNPQGQKHGTGVLTWDDGDQYVGMFVTDEKTNGIFTWKNGDQYSGEFKNNLMHGKGTFIYADKRKYVGDWYCGFKEGKGSLTFPNQDSYEGEFSKDNFHGLGCYKYSDGRMYKGYYTMNKRNGWGVFFWANGSKILGAWNKDQLNGIAIETDSLGRRQEQLYIKDEKKGEPVLLKRTEEEMKILVKSCETPSWVPDHQMSNCFKCDALFNLVNRRHHCRFCGQIFCGECSTSRGRVASSPQMSRFCDECFIIRPTFELQK
jgi:hypothetical protein